MSKYLFTGTCSNQIFLPTFAKIIMLNFWRRVYIEVFGVFRRWRIITYIDLTMFNHGSRRHYELISKFNVGLKTLLREGLSEPEFYGDLVDKLKKLIGRNDFYF